MNHIIKNLIISGLAVCTSHAALGNEQEDVKLAPSIPPVALAGDGLKQLEDEPDYHRPKPILRPSPTYPKKPLKKGQEGMVNVRFMVDKDGKVFEPIVLESTNSAFEASALKAILKYQYEPAHVNGVPLNAATSILINYEVEGGEDAADRDFRRIYKRADKRLNSKNPDQQELKRDLNRLADADYLTSYGLAYLAKLEYRYASKFLSKQEQLKSLRKLLLFENMIDEERRFLDQATIETIRMSILQLLIELGYYGEARVNFYRLSKEIPNAGKPFEDAISQIEKILSGDEAIMRSLNLGDRGYEYLNLAKKSFEIDAIEGAIEKLNLYCTRGFTTLAFKPNSNYQVPEKLGSCDLLIVGQPNTKAKLYQL